MKPFVKVQIVLHGLEDEEPWDFEDRIDDDGKFIPLGTQVAGMLENHEPIFINGGFDSGEHIELLIPYHAIEAYTIIKDSKEFTEPEDAFCYENPCKCDRPSCDGGGGGGSRTVSLAKDGSDKTTTYEVEFLFDYLIPYMLNNGISVKYGDNEVTSVTRTGFATDNEYTWTLEDENGSYIIDAEYDSYDSVLYPTVDGESVDSLSFVVDTDKRYIMFSDVVGGQINVLSEELYETGSVLTAPAGYTKYYSRSPYDSSRYLIEDGFPTVDTDAWYSLQ